MNQKNYSFLLCSLLMASYEIYGIELIDDMLHNPFTSPVMVSQDEHNQENDQAEWTKTYARKIARYFFYKDYEQITEDELVDYLNRNRQIGEESKDINFEFMLGAVNGLLEKYELEHKLGLIAQSFSEDKELSNIKDFNTVVTRAMRLFGGLKSKVAKKLKQLPNDEKNRILTEINAVLQKQPVDRSSKQFNENIQRIIDSFKKEGREGVSGFSEILQKAKNLKLSDYFISQLEKLSPREKGNLFLMIDMMLPTKAEVANALELAQVTHAEYEKQKSRDRDLDIRRRQEESEKNQRKVVHALDLANSIQAEVAKTEKDFNKYVEEHNIKTPEELKKYALGALKPSMLKLIDRDVELSTVKNDNLGDIQDITKEELIEQAEKDGVSKYLLKDLNLLDEEDIHSLIHEVIMQDRNEKALDLARSVVKNKKDKEADSDRDMKPVYESGSDEDKDSVANALNLSKDASKNQKPETSKRRKIKDISELDQDDFDEQEMSQINSSNKQENDDEGMDERQNAFGPDSEEDEDFDENDEKLSQGLFGNDDDNDENLNEEEIPYSGKDGMLSKTVQNADEQNDDEDADQQEKEEPVAPPALEEGPYSGNADEQDTEFGNIFDENIKGNTF